MPDMVPSKTLAGKGKAGMAEGRTRDEDVPTRPGWPCEHGEYAHSASARKARHLGDVDVGVAIMPGRQRVGLSVADGIDKVIALNVDELRVEARGGIEDVAGAPDQVLDIALDPLGPRLPWTRVRGDAGREGAESVARNDVLLLDHGAGGPREASSESGRPVEGSSRVLRSPKRSHLAGKVVFGTLQREGRRVGYSLPFMAFSKTRESARCAQRHCRCQILDMIHAQSSRSRGGRPMVSTRSVCPVRQYRSF